MWKLLIGEENLFVLKEVVWVDTTAKAIEENVVATTPLAYARPSTNTVTFTLLVCVEVDDNLLA